jgi:hypothetical protein
MIDLAKILGVAAVRGIYLLQSFLPNLRFVQPRPEP